MVVYGRTSRLRRTYYIRSLALRPELAKETRVFGLADWLVDRYRQGWLAEMSEVWRARKEGWSTSLVSVGVLAAAETVALVLIARDSVSGAIALGSTVTLAQAVLGASVLGLFQEDNWGLSECSRSLQALEEVEVDAGRIGGLNGGTREPGGMPARSIRFHDVGFTYPGRTRPVFDGFDLELEAGRSLAIVGENGSGKTTLIKLLCRFYDPDQGSISVDGVDLRELDAESWQHRVAAVFQDYVRFELPAYENVAYGALHRRDDQAGVAEAARLAGAAAVVERLPDGWSTPLTRELIGGTQLSGGEWQRLALARALFAVRGGAGLLILDEPTASLDVRGEAEVYDRFLELTRGATTIVVSHRFSTVRRADRIVVVDEGRIVEDGTHDELVALGGLYARMYRLQALRFEGDDA
jgi:ATP-binding cassette subfamily B protein